LSAISVPAFRTRSSSYSAETRTGAIRERSRPLINIPMCRTCGSGPQRSGEAVLLSSCFALIVFRLAKSL
jgi:hypothetical protein